jgi:hypothetical protein
VWWRRTGGLVVAAVLWLGVCPVATAQDPPTGVYVETPDGPQEVGVYTNRTRAGGVRLAVGTLDEVPMVPVPGLVRLFCNLPFWRVQSAFIATGRIVRDDRAERRRLTLRARQLSITAMSVEVVAADNPAQLKPLLDAVGATPENPAYVFLTMESRGAIRDYIVGLNADP